MAPTLMINRGTELAKAASLTSRAYVTFLAGNGDYVKGVVGLAKGLRKVNTAYPLVVAVLPDVPEDHRRILVAQGCIVREIEPVYPPENQTQFAMAYYVINYSKLRIWEVIIFYYSHNKFLCWLNYRAVWNDTEQNFIKSTKILVNDSLFAKILVDIFFYQIR